MWGKMKILFLGSPNFAKIVLQGLIDDGHEIVAVICQPDRPASRGHQIQMPAVKEFCIEKNITVLQYEKVNEHIDEIKKLNFDLFITAAFGQILSKDFLEISFGVNVHPSLLPKLRGATPIQTALLKNSSITGVTIQKIVYEVDAGDIIEQETLPIEAEDDYLSLEFKLAKLSNKLLSKALKKIKDKELDFRPQIGQPSYTKIINKEDGRLDFNKPGIDNLGIIRALFHNPGAYFTINGQRIKVLKARLVSDNILYAPKDILKDKNGFMIKCKDSVIEILQLIGPSGKIMNGKAFLNGLRNVTRVD